MAGISGRGNLGETPKVVGISGTVITAQDAKIQQVAASAISGSGVFTPSQQDLAIEITPVTKDAEITLTPKDSKPARGVWLGIKTASYISYITTDDHQKKLEEAFNEVFDLVKGEPTLEMTDLEINLDTLVVTIYDKEGLPTKWSLQQLRAKLLEGGENDETRLGEVRKKLDGSFEELRRIVVTLGTRKVWNNQMGADTSKYCVGEMPLLLRRAEIFSKLPRTSFMDSMKADKGGIKTILDAIPDQPKQHRAAKQIVRVEAFLIEFRKKLIEKQNELLSTQPEENDDEKCAEDKQEIARLLYHLENEHDRYALFWAAAFRNNEGAPAENAEACYQAMRKPLYEAAIAGMKQSKRPPNEDAFYQSLEGRLANEYAVDIAATVLSDIKDWKRFYMEKDISPKKDHINQLVLSEGDSIPRGLIKEIAAEAKKVSGVIGEQFDRVATGGSTVELSAKRRLEVMLENNQDNVAELLKDPFVSKGFLGSIVSRLGSFFIRK